MSRLIIGIFFYTNDDDTANVIPQLLGLIELAFQHEKSSISKDGIGNFRL